MVRRRPCTLDEMAASLGVTLEEAQFTLRKLEESNRIVRYTLQDREFICHRDRT
jgi:predicted ArsR family transcriptional regulator